MEAPIGATQHWESSVYTTLEDLEAEVERLNKRIKLLKSTH